MVSTSLGQIWGRAVQSGTSRPKKRKKSSVPLQSAPKLKPVWRKAMMKMAASSATVMAPLMRPATGGLGMAVGSGTAQVLLLQRSAVDVLERRVRGLVRGAVEHHVPVAHADDAVRVLAGHVDEVE